MQWAEEKHCRSQEDITALQCINAQLTSQLKVFGIKLDELYHCMPPSSTPDVPIDVYDDDFSDDDGCPPIIDIILYHF